MKIAIAAFALFACLAAATLAAAQHMIPNGIIPAQFHGRWAENLRECRKPAPESSAITINRRGWTAFEDGGELQRVGQVRGATHYFQVLNMDGDSETIGSIALRRVGTRLAMTFDDGVAGRPPTHRLYLRCR